MIEFINEQQEKHFETCELAWDWGTRTDCGLGGEVEDNVYCGCGEWLGYSLGGRRSGMYE